MFKAPEKKPAAKAAPAAAIPAAKPADPAAAARREIIQALKGPVCDRLKTVIPALAGNDDVYGTVMGNPDLLYGCLQLLRARREVFQGLLVDAQGQPVTADDQPLRCERTLTDIVGMIVRSGAHAYGERRFATPDLPPPVSRAELREQLETLRSIAAAKWETDIPLKRIPGKPAVKQTAAEAFYAAVKDSLENDWQVPLIPFYAELPPRLLSELGRGLATLRTGEAITALAELGRRTLDTARRSLSEAALREMLDSQPMAVEGIAFLGKDRFESLDALLHEKMGLAFWEMCTDTDRLEALENRQPRDVEQLAGQLHRLSGPIISYILDKMLVWQMAPFLEFSAEKLGDRRFVAVFGVPGSSAVSRRLVDMAAEFKPRRQVMATEEFAEALPNILGAYLRDPKGFEKGW